MKTLEQRFWEKVLIIPFSDCWLWIAGTTKGYGYFECNGKQRTASRVSWEMHFGSIPEGKQIRHKCDNPPCIRPSHLELGSHEDNMKDMYSRKRHSHGEKHYKNKLTEEDIFKIRADNRTQQEIADEYKVSRENIKSIKLRKIWKHL